MREGNRLTAASVRNANKPGLKADGHNLYLQISKFGTKAWLFRYMMNGVSHKMGLGAVHTVSLAEARKRAAGARLKVHDGIDPIDQRKASRTRDKLASARRYLQTVRGSLHRGESRRLAEPETRRSMGRYLR
jgi:hypothetical protein